MARPSQHGKPPVNRQSATGSLLERQDTRTDTKGVGPNCQAATDCQHSATQEMDMEATEVTPERLLRDSEVAEVLGCSRSFVWRLIASEDLDSIHVGRLRRIP